MRMFRVVAVVCAALGALAAHAADNFWISGGKLMRGTKPLTLRAVHTPELAASTAKISEMVPVFVKIGRVGAVSLWYDVPGLNAEGTAMDPKAVTALGEIAKRAKDTRLALILRVPGPGGSAEQRKLATETVAKALKGLDIALYWIDGDDAADLAKIFKKHAPKCLVIAEQGGDLDVLAAEGAKADPKAVLVDRIPADPWGDQHFLLRTGDEATLASIEAAMARPEEKMEYTPDNSLLTEDERKEGFVSLFNGKNLDGWWFYGNDKGGFKVTPEGAIAWVREGGGGLISHKRYKDFVLRYEIRLFKEGDNSGTYIRAPRAGRQSKLGMEFQMMGDAGKAPDKNTTGAVYDVVPPLVNANKPAGQWNTVEIDFRGPRLKATLNGQVVQDLNFDDLEELKYRNRDGFIGLQDHNCPVEWRNLRIKEL